jgi:hypothetical protein
VAFVGTEVSERHFASISRVKKILNLPSSQRGCTSRRTGKRASSNVPPKRRFLQEPHCVISQKTAILHCYRGENKKVILQNICYLNSVPVIGLLEIYNCHNPGYYPSSYLLYNTPAIGNWILPPSSAGTYSVGPMDTA